MEATKSCSGLLLKPIPGLWGYCCFWAATDGGTRGAGIGGGTGRRGKVVGLLGWPVESGKGRETLKNVTVYHKKKLHGYTHTL